MAKAKTYNKTTAFRSTPEMEAKIEEVQLNAQQETGIRISRSQIMAKLVNEGYNVWKKRMEERESK